MKIIGKIIRGYFLFLFYVFVFVTVFDFISPGYRDSMKAIRENDKNEKVTKSIMRSVKLSVIRPSPNNYDINHTTKFSMTYICGLDDAGSLRSVSLESIDPSWYDTFIKEELEDSSSMFDHHICNDIYTSTTIKSVGAFVSINR